MPHWEWFEAGKVVERRGWGEVDITELAELDSQAPTGPPLVVLCPTPLSVDAARQIAALHGAGRAIAVVTANEVAADVEQWLPGGVVEFVPRRRGAVTEDSTGPPASADNGPPIHRLAQDVGPAFMDGLMEAYRQSRFTHDTWQQGDKILMLQDGDQPWMSKGAELLVLGPSDGYVTFRVRDPESGQEGVVDYSESDCEYLTEDFRTWYQEHLGRPDPEGVAVSDLAVGDDVVDDLRYLVDELARREPVDHHPGSQGKVRDLVHPSLYPFVEGVTPYRPKWRAPDPEYDRFGRPFERSRYQWLPTPFRIADDGAVSIESYINNLDRTQYAALYSRLADLFASARPLLESVLGYVAREFPGARHLGSDTSEHPATNLGIPSLAGREVLVVPKIVDYELRQGDSSEGVWHVEGMSHEHIVATCVFVLDRDPSVDGGLLSFKRPFTLSEIATIERDMHSSEMGYDPYAMIREGLVPIGTVPTPSGRLIVFPNCHVHRLSRLSLRASAARGRRRVIVFWVVDPDVSIPSTRDIPPQQGVIPHEDALRMRLELMEERRLHKQTLNPRAISLCEH
jgi:hypothetical protein